MRFSGTIYVRLCVYREAYRDGRWDGHHPVLTANPLPIRKVAIDSRCLCSDGAFFVFFLLSTAIVLGRRGVSSSCIFAFAIIIFYWVFLHIKKKSKPSQNHTQEKKARFIIARCCTCVCVGLGVMLVDPPAPLPPASCLSLSLCVLRRCACLPSYPPASPASPCLPCPLPPCHPAPAPAAILPCPPAPCPPIHDPLLCSPTCYMAPQTPLWGGGEGGVSFFNRGLFNL